MVNGVGISTYAGDFFLKNNVFIAECNTLFSLIDSQIYVQSLRDVMKGDFSILNGGLSASMHALRRYPEEKAHGYVRQLLAVIETYGTMDSMLSQLEAILTQAKRNVNQTARGITQVGELIIFLLEAYEKNALDPNLKANLEKNINRMAVLLYHNTELLEKIISFELKRSLRGSATIRMIWLFLRASEILTSKAYKPAAYALLTYVVACDKKWAVKSSHIQSMRYACWLAQVYRRIYLRTRNSHCLERHKFWFGVAIRRFEESYQNSGIDNTQSSDFTCEFGLMMMNLVNDKSTKNKDYFDFLGYNWL